MSERPDLDERAGLDDKYEQMLHLADLFSRAGGDLRSRSGLGPEVLDDPDLADSEPLSPATWREAEDEVRAATTGRGGLVGRSVELDADALVVRATVLTYRWIDDLASAAYETLGAIAGRAIGYLAPEVALGGSIVSAGLIETDAADRDEVAGYLGELAGMHPALMDHVSSGGGGLLDSLQLRSLLSVSALARDDAPLAAAAGLRTLGIEDLGLDVGSAARDIAGGLLDADADPDPDADDDGAAGAAGAPRGLEELLVRLVHARSSVEVRAVGGGRFVAYLAGPDAGRRARAGGARGARRAGDAGGRRARRRHRGRGRRGRRDRRGPGLVQRGAGGHGGRAGRPGAAHPGADAGAEPRGPLRPGGAARLAGQRRRREPADRRLRRPSDLRRSRRRGRARAAGPGLRRRRAADRARHAPVVAELERLRDLGYLAR